MHVSDGPQFLHKGINKRTQSAVPTHSNLSSGCAVIGLAAGNGHSPVLKDQFWCLGPLRSLMTFIFRRMDNIGTQLLSRYYLALQVTKNKGKTINILIGSCLLLSRTYYFYFLIEF